MSDQLRIGDLGNDQYGIVVRLGFERRYKDVVDRLGERLGLVSTQEVLQKAAHDFALKNGIAAPEQHVPTTPELEQLVAQGLISTDRVESIKTGRVWARRNELEYVEVILFYEKQERWFARLMEHTGLTEGQVVWRAIYSLYEQQS